MNIKYIMVNERDKTQKALWYCMTSFICFLPLTRVTERRVDKVWQGKLEEDSRNCGDCRQVYSLRAAAAGSLQRLLIY